MYAYICVFKPLTRNIRIFEHLFEILLKSIYTVYDIVAVIVCRCADDDRHDGRTGFLSGRPTVDGTL